MRTPHENFMFYTSLGSMDHALTIGWINLVSLRYLMHLFPEADPPALGGWRFFESLARGCDCRNALGFH